MKELRSSKKDLEDKYQQFADKELKNFPALERQYALLLRTEIKMKKKADWKTRYRIAISETMTIRDIMMLLDCGQSGAIRIRNLAIEYCLTNDIEILTRSVPTEAVLKVVRKDIEYYYQKMLLEKRIDQA